MSDIFTNASQEFFWKGFFHEFERSGWNSPNGSFDFWGCYIMGGEL